MTDPPARLIYVNRTLRTQDDADTLRIDIVAKAIADRWDSEPDRAYWRRKAKIAIQVIKDLTT